MIIISFFTFITFLKNNTRITNVEERINRLKETFVRDYTDNEVKMWIKEMQILAEGNILDKVSY